MMRWSLVMLFVSFVTVESLYGEELPCQASKPTASKAGDLPFSCYCPLFPINSENWYGEFHPTDSNCLTPEAVYFDSRQSTQFCVPPNCGCVVVVVVEPPCKCSDHLCPKILQEPVPYDFFPDPCTDDTNMDFPNEHARNCLFSDPRFITFKVPGRTVFARLFAVTVDVNKRTGRAGHRLRGKKHLAFLGFECKEPPEHEEITPKDVVIKKNCGGHIVVDLVLHEGIVLLAN